MLGSDEALGLLEAYGLRCTRRRLATTAEEAARAAEELGGPVALKIRAGDRPSGRAPCVRAT